VLRHLAPEICGMSSHTAPSDQFSASFGSVRAHRGDDAAELQRRLEAFLLIARRVAPALRAASA
jgi:hypothetical protein